MKPTALLLLAFVIPFSGTLKAQSNALVSNYQLSNYSDPIVSGDSIYIPVRSKDKKFTIHISALSDSEIAQIYSPPENMELASNFTIDDDHIYYHTTESVTKIDRKSNNLLWEANYSSKWAAQWEPEILGKYVVSITDDTILILDKNTGAIVQEIKGRGFEDGISLSGNNFIGTKGGGKTFAIDLSTGEKIWSIDVGDEAGYGSVTDGDNIYLPSWDPKFYSLNRTTGKTNWILDLRKIKNGCGSGFEEAPVLVGDNLYAVHRDYGLFIINKNTGAVSEVIDFGVNIVDNLVEYKGNLVFCSNNYLHIFSIKENKEVKRIKLPQEVLSGVTLKNNYAIIGEGNQYNRTANVMVFDLDLALNN